MPVGRLPVSRLAPAPRLTTMSNFLIHALPAGEIDPDTPLGQRVTADGPSPCRRCLRNATAGEALLLLPYDPFTQASPYAGSGPVFVHADGCQTHRLARRAVRAGDRPDPVRAGL